MVAASDVLPAEVLKELDDETIAELDEGFGIYWKEGKMPLSSAHKELRIVLLSAVTIACLNYTDHLFAWDDIPGGCLVSKVFFNHDTETAEYFEMLKTSWLSFKLSQMIKGRGVRTHLPHKETVKAILGVLRLCSHYAPYTENEKKLKRQALDLEAMQLEHRAKRLRDDIKAIV